VLYADHYSRKDMGRNNRQNNGIHLFATEVPIADPLSQLRPPVLQHVRLRKLDTLTVTEAALSASRRDRVHRVKIDFQPLARFRRDLLLRTPGTSVALLLQPGRINIWSGITDLYFPFPAFLSRYDRRGDRELLLGNPR